MLIGFLFVTGIMISFVLLVICIRDKSTYIRNMSLHIFRIVEFKVEVAEKRNLLVERDQEINQ